MRTSQRLKINFLASFLNCDARGRKRRSSLLSRNSSLLSEPFNFLPCRFYFQATGNAFTSRQFSLETPRRFVVGCTCCNVAATRCTRAFLRKCRNYAAFGRRPLRKLQLRASFQRAVGAMHPVRRTSPNLRSCAKVFFSFRTRTICARCQIDRRKVLSPCCKGCSRIDEEHIRNTL